MASSAGTQSLPISEGVLTDNLPISGDLSDNTGIAKYLLDLQREEEAAQAAREAQAAQAMLELEKAAPPILDN